jgi:hypothetical protein
MLLPMQVTTHKREVGTPTRHLATAWGQCHHLLGADVVAGDFWVARTVEELPVYLWFTI